MKQNTNDLAHQAHEVPSPIDLRQEKDAREWANTAMLKRPWRVDFFQAFSEEIFRKAEAKQIRVLELCSGPGFLAEHLLKIQPSMEYVALDFSAAMHTLATQRLGSLAQRVQFVERSFRDASWVDGLGKFDAVVTLQAIHELRHKRYASVLHAQVRQLLAENGTYLVCDHFCGEGGMSNDQLFMSRHEQCAAIEQGGFRHVHEVLVKGTLAFYRAH